MSQITHVGRLLKWDSQRAQKKFPLSFYFKVFPAVTHMDAALPVQHPGSV